MSNTGIFTVFINRTIDLQAEGLSFDMIRKGVYHMKEVDFMKLVVSDGLPNRQNTLDLCKRELLDGSRELSGVSSVFQKSDSDNFFQNLKKILSGSKTGNTFSKSCVDSKKSFQWRKRYVFTLVLCMIVLGAGLKISGIVSFHHNYIYEAADQMPSESGNYDSDTNALNPESSNAADEENEHSSNEPVSKQKVDFDVLPYYEQNSLHFEMNDTVSIKAPMGVSYEHVLIYRIGDENTIKVSHLSSSEPFEWTVEQAGSYLIFYEKDGALIDITEQVDVEHSISAAENNFLVPLD